MLEQDLAEGRQAKDPSYVPWRRMGSHAMYDRKIIIYSMQGASKAGQKVQDFIQPYHNKAEDILQDRKRRRQSYMRCLFALLTADFRRKYKTPVNFESKVLNWKHTPLLAKQAAITPHTQQ